MACGVGPAPTPTGSFRSAPATLNREAAELPSASAMPAEASEGSGDRPSEIVIRPTGLRHGKWEAPAWAFWTAGGLVMVCALVYALFRLGYFRRKA
jgi:hypothetical protein